MRLLKTGIEGLDELMGGIPEGTRTILYGPSGSGKTVFAMQFIWNGLQNGETVAYDVLDRPWPLLRRYFKSFGWDIEPYEERKKMMAIQGFPHFDPYPKDPRVHYFTLTDFEELKRLDALITESGATRFVAGDSSQAIFDILPVEQLGEIENWTSNWTFYDKITDLDIITSAKISDKARAYFELDRKRANNFIQFRVHKNKRELKIVKLEGSKHPLEWLPFEITPTGIQML